MTIRQRLVLSFCAILALIAANQLVYFWSAGLRAQTVTRLDHARSRQLVIGSLRQDIGNLHKQVSLSNEIKPYQATDAQEASQSVKDKLEWIGTRLAQLTELTDAQSSGGMDELRAACGELAREWTGYYALLGKDESSALTHLARSEPVAQRVLDQLLPALQEKEEQNVHNATAEFEDVGRLTNRITIVFFLLSIIVAIAVAYSVSRHLTRGLSELKEGAALIGGMRFGHRITVQHTDELGDLAKAFNDMAEHLRSANENLSTSEQRYRSLVDRAVYGIYRCNLEGKFLDINPALAAMLGYTSQELLALDPARDVFVDLEWNRLAQHVRRAGRVEAVEVQWKHKDGTRLAVRLSGSLQSTEHGVTKDLEMIAEDVTEKRQLEEQLRQSQKMEAVGRLAGGVAHDFNNLLTVIRGHSDLILDDLREGDPLRPDVEEVRRAADRAASLTGQLLAFSRRQVLAPKVLNINTLVERMQKLLFRLLGEDVELVTVLDPQLGYVKADPSQIEQVIMNLAVNARDAMPRGGVLTLQTANVKLDEAYIRERVDLKAGDHTMLCVSDTGTGMDSATRAHIFEPFFTTKEQGKGTGLGLSTVYGIVKQSGGDVWVYSEIGRGTTFKIYLPRVDCEPETGKRPRVQEANQGTETILVVEDEDGVRNLVRQVLQKDGYQVLVAECGGEAERLCKAHSGPIHLLLTDVVLKEINGQDLSKSLIRLRPQMRVLFMSGYTDDAILQRGVLNHDTAFLHKPFTPSGLSLKIREVLDKVLQ